MSKLTKDAFLNCVRFTRKNDFTTLYQYVPANRGDGIKHDAYIVKIDTYGRAYHCTVAEVSENKFSAFNLMMGEAFTHEHLFENFITEK
jgi:hypothetical protein